MKKLSDETGDVPGWVLITLMTAGLVVVIWSVASPAMKSLIDESMNRVTSL